MNKIRNLTTKGGGDILARKIFIPQKVKYFIVTYNSIFALMMNLENLFNCLEEPDISVINNHNKTIASEIHKKYPTVKVYDNVIRHPNSKGHLARSWNQCLLFGFGSARNPETDWVVGIQDDVIVDRRFWQEVKAQMDDRDFIMVGPGDQIWLSNLSALLKIGFWDEHFISTAYQEADYYHRAYLHLRERCILEDSLHQPDGPKLITNNNCNLKNFINLSKNENNILKEEWGHRQNYVLHNLNEQYFKHKWNTTLEPHNFEISKDYSHSIPGEYCFYPWFFA